MRHVFVLVVAIAVVSVALFAQTPASPSFEVATVKENTKPPGGTVGIMIQPGGRVNVMNSPLHAIIISAFQISNFQLIGAPEWIKATRYDILAKAESNPDVMTHLGLLRQLLVDRFHLQTHQEEREMAVYALVRTKPNVSLGPRLRPTAVDCGTLLADARNGKPLPKANRVLCGVSTRSGSISAGGTTMKQLGRYLSPLIEREVVDQTGLEGMFDFDLDFRPDTSSASNDPALADAPSLFTALQEQLGLKLEPSRGRVEVLVIDHIERPTEN